MIALFLGLSLYAQTNYPMIVVKEARVGQRTQISSPSLACQTNLKTTNALKSLHWIGSKNRKPEPILALDKNATIYATRNTDDSYLNSVTLWLVSKSKNGVKYFELTEVNMENYELPDVQLKQDTLIIRANAMKADPDNAEDEFMKDHPVIKSKMYQTIQITNSANDQIQIKSLVCIQ